MANPPSGPLPQQWQALLMVLMAAGVLAAFSPALDIFLAGDDFEWLEESYDLVARPMLSFELINHFFRPLIKWTYLGDYLIFGTMGVGYIATSLLIHFANSFLLFVLINRRISQPLVAAGSAAAFALSPLHSEAILWAAGRPDTVLLACWLAAILLLDGWCDRPGVGRATAFTFVALLGIGAKESWVVFPILATGYVVWVRRESIATGFRRTAVVWTAWLAYLVVFFILPMTSNQATATHYADFTIVPAAVKTSRTLLGYCGLGWTGIAGWPAFVVAGFLVVVTAAWLVRTRTGFGGWSLLWMAASLALAAPFPLSVLRHNYLPLAGFWMLAAVVLDRIPGGAPDKAAPGRRRFRMAMTVALIFAVLTVEAWFLQREIVDYRLYGDLHFRLCQALASVEPEISRERPLVLINQGNLRGVEFMASSVQGGYKTFFVRRDALWQLVFLPQLADFVGQPFEERLVRIAPLERGVVQTGCTVVLFNDNGFHLRPDLEDQVITAMRAGELPPTISIYRYEKLSAPGG